MPDGFFEEGILEDRIDIKLIHSQEDSVFIMLRSTPTIVLIFAAFACALAAPTDEKPSTIASSGTTSESKQPDSPQELPGLILLEPEPSPEESDSPEELPRAVLVEEEPQDEHHSDSEEKPTSDEDKSDLDTAETSHHHSYHVYYAPRWSGYYVGGYSRHGWGHGRGYGWKAHYWY